MNYFDSESAGGALPDTQELADALLAAAAAGNFAIELMRAVRGSTGWRAGRSA